jgi:hypothetical protein
MTAPPKLVSVSEMEKLFADLHKEIDECRIRTIEVREEPPPGSSYTKKTISLFLHPTTENEIALKTDYVNNDGSKSSVISKVRIGQTSYELEATN